MARSKETNEEAVWRIFMNSPGPECAKLYGDATKILTSRNIIKAPRKRVTSEDTGRRRHPSGKEAGTES